MDIKSLCLGALSLGDASGYEIKKMFEEGLFSHFYDAGYGSIYPALNKLLADHLVTCVEVEQTSRPAKKVYSLTTEGLAALKVDLNQQPVRDKMRSESIAMMFFGHLLEPAHRADVLQSHIEHYREGYRCIAEINPIGQSNGQQFVRGLGLAVYEAAAAYLEENQDLLLSTDDLPEAVDPAKLTGDAA